MLSFTNNLVSLKSEKQIEIQIMISHGSIWLSDGYIHLQCT